MSTPAQSTKADNDAIEALAASWLVRRDEGFTHAQAAEFDRWRDADPRHAAAVAMLEETCGILGRMPLLQVDLGSAGGSPASSGCGRAARAPKAKILSFPATLKFVAALAACMAVGVAVWSLRGDRQTSSQTYVTDIAGDHRRLVLADKSVIELNAATEVRVEFSKAARGVTLVRGEAHFMVAKDKARPFQVGAGKVAVRAVGTAFNVRLEKAAVEVIVTEGRVQVSQLASIPAVSLMTASATEATLLDAGQRLIVATDNPQEFRPQVTWVNPSAMGTPLLAPAPRLVFVDTPLSEVVQQFNRHNRVQLEIGDSELGDRAVGGTFRADHVETFVRLLQDSRDINVERPDPNRIVLRRVAPGR